ncbi:hypothetical protein HAHE_14350 [Haloferula helveola]|uniref:Uncharacterized protein n=1 Tax=Haloferula helveola TaxID=490095 RepID=A0ABM7RBV2_9BACT|nr:hypothetical protein HAHE_14350 [Haloferula helveola]
MQQDTYGCPLPQGQGCSFRVLSPRLGPSLMAGDWIGAEALAMLSIDESSSCGRARYVIP